MDHPPNFEPSTGDDAPRAVEPPTRVESIDLLRGIVMVVMVLDHVRDFFGDSKLDPTNLSVTTPALFLTRWITHFCAPTFILLAGVSASLSGARRTRSEESWHLVKRGLWLIFLEQTLGNIFMFFTYPHVVLGLILWGIGWSMIALAGLIYLPRCVVGGMGVAMIALHNLFDGVQPQGEIAQLIWSFLHAPGMRFFPGGLPILVGYPLIPWVGVMAVGYALGPIFSRPAEIRRRLLFRLGLSAIAGFVALRWLNVYGDPGPWMVQANPAFTVLSFLNCQKYPPSLLYLLMTLGPAFIGLAILDRGIGRLGIPLRTIGQVPLFFYLLQWPFAHGLAVLVAALQGDPIGWMFEFPPFQSPICYGHSLATVYLFWVITVGLLYYPSLRYRDWRRLRRDSR